VYVRPTQKGMVSAPVATEAPQAVRA
jgi:hypothetical protein